MSVGADQIGSLIADRTVLSNQEAQVEARIQEGMSAGEIADDMDLSESTVRTVKERIRRKVANAKRTMELVETGG